MKPLTVKEVKYIDGYKLEIIFTDDKKKLVSFQQYDFGKKLGYDFSSV